MRGLILVILSCVSLTARGDNTNPTVSFIPKNGAIAGPKDPYVCNVGLRHMPYTGPKLCWVPSSLAPCNPNTATEQCECITPEHANKGDYAHYTVKSDPLNKKTLLASTTTNYQSIFSSASTFNEPITSLYFNFGSEMYGTSLYVDVCYPMPVIATADPLGHLFETSIYVDDIGLGVPTHATLSRPRVSITGSSLNCYIHPPVENVLLVGNAVFAQWRQLPDQGCTIRYEITETANVPRAWAKKESNYVIWTKLPERNCTYTQGYWKNHGNPDEKRYDAVWSMLPEGMNTQFLQGGTWGDVFNRSVSGDKWYALAHQYQAATLNTMGGANSDAISQELAAAEQLLKTLPPTAKITGSVNDQVTSLIEKLTAYNEGSIGPGHCGD